MTKAMFHAAYSASCIVLVYLAFVFINLKPDPTCWDEGIRAMFLLLLCALEAGANFAAHEHYEFYKKNRYSKRK